MADQNGNSDGNAVRVGAASEFRDGDRRIIDVGERQIGVFRVDGEFVAYENRCAHQGGPVCEGQYYPQMEAVFDDRGRSLGERANYDVPHLVCPWHSWEYDLRTGEMVGLRKLKLRAFPTVEREGDVYVIV